MAICVKLKSPRRSNASGDFTIYDFAHNYRQQGPSDRVPKFNKLPIANTAEELSMDDDRRDGTTNVSIAGLDQPTVYYDYAIDIWYLISEHIRPEDVGRFALICRKTAEVVTSAKFWVTLYRKYFTYKVDLPRKLQPDCMTMLRGLRTRTILSLFYTYRPFVTRLGLMAYTDPHRVAGRQVLFCWHTRCKTGWNYCFKLRARLIPGSRAALSAQLQRQKSSSFEYLQDTYHNPEEGCQILIISTEQTHIVPPLDEHQQLWVGSLKQTLSQCTRYKVHLQLTNYCRRPVNGLEFFPVRQIRVLDWWNPEYYKEDPTAIERSGQDLQPLEQESSDAATVIPFWDD